MRAVKKWDTLTGLLFPIAFDRILDDYGSVGIFILSRLFL